MRLVYKINKFYHGLNILLQAALVGYVTDIFITQMHKFEQLDVMKNIVAYYAHVRRHKFRNYWQCKNTTEQ